MSPYTWTLDRAMDRERQRGADLAGRDWEAGERTPLRDRDVVAWGALRGCEQSGYMTAWNRHRRAGDEATSPQQMYVERQERDRLAALEAEA